MAVGRSSGSWRKRRIFDEHLPYDSPSLTTWLNSERPTADSARATELFWNPDISEEEGQRLLAIAKCFRTPTATYHIVFLPSDVITAVSLCGGLNTIGSKQLKDRSRIKTITYVADSPNIRRSAVWV